MIKLLGIGILAVLVSSVATFATCPTWHTLTNGTTASASDVMDNFGVVFGCPVFTGNVGIGMVPSNVLDITQNLNASAVGQIYNPNAGAAAGAVWLVFNGNGQAQFGVLGGSYATNGILSANRGYAYGSYGLAITTGAGYPVDVAAGSTTQAARFATDGSFLVGTTTNGGWTGGAKIEAKTAATLALSAYSTNSTYGSAAFLARVDSTTVVFASWNYAGTQVGTIATNGSTTAYNTTSDERLKTVLPHQSDYRPAINHLWVGDFEWKQTHKQGFGILAQQAFPLFPEAITRPGIPSGLWQADYGKLAPLALWGVKDLYKSEELQRRQIEVLNRDVSVLKNELISSRQRQTQLERKLSFLEQMIGRRTAQN